MNAGWQPPQGEPGGAQYPGNSPQPGPPKWLWWLLGAIAAVLVAAVVVFFVFFNTPEDAADSESPTSSSSQKPKPTRDRTTGPSPSPSVTPNPTPTQAPPETVIPGCATLHPGAQAQADQAVTTYGNRLNPSGEVDRSTFDRDFGPVAQRTMDRVSEMRGCYYVFHYEASLTVFVSKISPADQAELTQSLQGDADFQQSTIGLAKVYAWAEPDPFYGTMYTVHAFMGNVWVATRTFSDPAEAITPVIDAMVAANPQLAG